MKIEKDQLKILTAALNGMPNGLAIYDLEGNLVMCNEQYNTFLDKFCQAEGGNLLKAGLPDEFMKAIQEEGHYTFLMYFDKNNNPAPDYVHGPVNRVHAAAVKEDGKLLGISLAVEDATAEVKREHQLNVYKRNAEFVLSHMHSGLVYISPTYRVEWKGIDSIYGQELAKKMYVEGTKCYQHFGLSEPCTDCPVTWAMRDKEDKHRVFHDPSNNTDLDVTVTVMKEADTIQGYLMELRDITKEAQAKRMLEEATNRANEGERAKSTFLNTVSHELRTPLNALLGFSEILYNSEHLSDEERKEYAKVVHQNSDMLHHMVNDMLVISDLDSGRYQIQKSIVDLHDLMQMCVMQVSERVPNGVDMHIEIPDELKNLTFETDQNRLSQAFHHMLTNACKHTTKGSIVLGVKLLHVENCNDDVKDHTIQQYLEFSVTDTGCGIPADKRDEIFRPFAKLDRFKSGTGLGLSICKIIAKHMGGIFKLDTEYNQGARFLLTHPISKNVNTCTVADVK